LAPRRRVEIICDPEMSECIAVAVMTAESATMNGCGEQTKHNSTVFMGETIGKSAHDQK
jgi:hypothetical protein